MSLSHNLTKSLNLNYNATNDNIINVNNILGTDLKKDDLNLFDDFLNIGDADYFNQNLTINYSLPLSSIPYLDFISRIVSSLSIELQVYLRFKCLVNIPLLIFVYPHLEQKYFTIVQVVNNIIY